MPNPSQRTDPYDPAPPNFSWRADSRRSQSVWEAAPPPNQDEDPLVTAPTHREDPQGSTSASKRNDNPLQTASPYGQGPNDPRSKWSDDTIDTGCLPVPEEVRNVFKKGEKKQEEKTNVPTGLGKVHELAKKASEVSLNELRKGLRRNTEEEQEPMPGPSKKKE